jgi:hypothetical protein
MLDLTMLQTRSSKDGKRRWSLQIAIGAHGHPLRTHDTSQSLRA